MKVFLIEEDKDYWNALVNYIEIRTNGIQVDELRRGEDVLKELQEGNNAYCIVIISIKRQELKEMELAQEIRKVSKGVGIVVIGLTNFPDKDYRSYGFNEIIDTLGENRFDIFIELLNKYYLLEVPAC